MERLFDIHVHVHVKYIAKIEMNLVFIKRVLMVKITGKNGFQL